MMRKLLSLLVLCLFISACTWVKLKPEAENTQVATAEEVGDCEKKGATTVSLKSDIAGFDRNPKKVKKELETLARNSSTALGGNTVVPVSAPEEGEQEFNVYLCAD